MIAISALLLSVDTQYVLPSYRISWSMNPLVILDLTSDLLFKVIGDFQGQSYTKHAISALEIMVKESPGDVRCDLCPFVQGHR